jgi:hypothetical protein
MKIKNGVKYLHPLVILPVLVLRVGQLLDTPLASAQILLRIAQPPVLSVKLRLQLPRKMSSLV